MPLLKQPATLEKLALTAVTEYVKTIAQNVFNRICTKVLRSPRAQDETLMKQKFDLETLNIALYKSTPHGLWMDITSSGIKAINQLLKDVTISEDKVNLHRDCKCLNFIEQLLSVVFGPHVTHVKFPGPSITPSQEILLKNFYGMKHLKVLELTGIVSREIVQRHFASLTSLTSFTMELFCNDYIIYTLAHNCNKLQTLDVSSSYYVTDSSVKSILKLQNLQNLKISSTNISGTGLLRILGAVNKLNGCAVKGVQTLKNLQALGCSEISNDHLHAIASSFSGLTYLSFYIVRCDFTILSQMKFLKNFKVNRGSFILNNISGLLEALGHQLETLDLQSVKDVDLCVIAKYCVNLKSLSICNSDVLPLPDNPDLSTNDRSVAFQRLIHFTFLNLCTANVLEFVIIRSIALRCLTIGKIMGIDDNFIVSCLARNPLKHLEILKIFYGIPMTMRSKNLLLESCPNLSEITEIRRISFAYQIQNKEIKLLN